jgi:intracellular sulfur oxidation DsrE/DsrF family protein
MHKTSGDRRAIVTQSLALAAATLCAGASQAAESIAAPGGTYKAAFQVSDADPQKWNLTLNNANNALTELGKGTTLEIVVFGPGIGMLKAGSVAAARVTEAMAAGIKVVACQNTMRGQHLEPKDMVAQIGYVPSGAAELIRKQAEGYAYMRS